MTEGVAVLSAFLVPFVTNSLRADFRAIGKNDSSATGSIITSFDGPMIEYHI